MLAISKSILKWWENGQYSNKRTYGFMSKTWFFSNTRYPKYPMILKINRVRIGYWKIFRVRVGYRVPVGPCSAAVGLVHLSRGRSRSTISSWQVGINNFGWIQTNTLTCDVYFRSFFEFLVDLERAGSRLWCLGGPSVSDWSLSVLWLEMWMKSMREARKTRPLPGVRIVIWILPSYNMNRETGMLSKARRKSNKPCITSAPSLSPNTTRPSWVRMGRPTWRPAKVVTILKFSSLTGVNLLLWGLCVAGLRDPLSWLHLST